MATWAGFVLAVDPAREGDLLLNFREIRRLEGWSMRRPRA
jgi:hypothetical protein